MRTPTPSELAEFLRALDLAQPTSSKDFTAAVRRWRFWYAEIAVASQQCLRSENLAQSPPIQP